MTGLALSTQDDGIEALKEVLNIGAGNAARVLGEMVGGQRIDIGIPEVAILSHTDQQAQSLLSDGVNVISLPFYGSISGRVFLLFQEESTPKLIRLLVDDSDEEEDLKALEEEVLSEVGNVVINGVIGAIGNLIGETFKCKIPVFHGTGFSLADLFESNEKKQLVYSKVDFKLDNTPANSSMKLLLLTDELEHLTKAALDFFEV